MASLDRDNVKEAIDGWKPALRDDGRVDIDTDSKLVRTLSLILPNSQKKAFQDVEEPPPPFTSSTAADTPILSVVKLNVVIQVVGSRGDVQPFIALGNELQKHGHRVRLATHNTFENFVRKSGLEFYPIGGDPADLMAYMVRNPGLIPSMDSLRAGDIQKKRKMMAEMLRGCWASCIEPDRATSIPFVADAIIANPPSFAHLHCAQALSIPVHLMFTMPWSITKAFPHPLANLTGAHTEMHMANAVSYSIVEFLTWQGLGDVINEWRTELDLEQIAFSDGPNLAETLRVPFTYCWSPALVPKPQDWGPHIDVCGFFFREPPEYTPPPDLEKYLRGGPPPVYIGFGSIVIDNPKALSATILEAVRITGVRALISRGWSNLDGPESSQVMFLGDCPHEWLFQHVAAVVHHGGAGTTACGLSNGRPTTIVPFFGDQPFWGDMVAAAGAGPKPIPQKDLTVETLSEAIRVCLTPEVAEAARKLAMRMKDESGVKAATAAFHANLPLNVLGCDILKEQPAVWMYRHKNSRVKLSKAAAEILTSHLKVDVARLKLHEIRPIIIDSRRWDPLTGTVSAAIGASRDIAVAASGVVVKPAEIYRKRSRIASSEVYEEDDPVKSGLPRTGSRGASPPPLRPRDKENRNCASLTSDMVLASVSGVGGFFKSSAGGIVAVPYAFAEGFRNIPRLYGEEVRDLGAIRDWKSGTIVGAKATFFGVVDGVSDLFVLPYKGAQKDGPVGAVKGVGKSLVGVTSKLFNVAVGVGAYPLRGIYKSVWTSAHQDTQRSIRQARRIEGFYLAERMRQGGFDDALVLRAFESIRKGSSLDLQLE
ncbi:Sterol 3-beta-glucosyltransferase UGT80B1-like protein 1 [Colletotrichum truncatum]|uniref:Sterol 3-beta-glucosyltransferase UGT80B1-like protein 1 n=1 Tax=Colletotrichum truncatum TaxID=5467 RepID=A0ACC3YS72_COLTU|nr:Sterol 3-beta-glucosyltransferase UGT80B1-like protein 1 [Colletotrichum truncatum]KAF6796745.1 Sterol 3-beta-glucosyltransferase UGT80B1-like protein 1 [Colletotrichum truncatum]